MSLILMIFWCDIDKIRQCSYRVRIIKIYKSGGVKIFNFPKLKIIYIVMTKGESGILLTFLPIPAQWRWALTHFLQHHTAWNTSPPANSKMATRGPQVIGLSNQLLLNKLFESKISKIKNGQQGLERGLLLSFWALPSSFAKSFFF